MNRKICSIILILMLVASILTIYPTYKTKASGTIYFVGGSGSGNYSSIQDAIDVSDSGDSVFVYSGTYYENIFVNKSINLIGEDKTNTIIDSNGEYDVINISANSVIISGFTICNSSFNNGIAINSSNNNVIKNNNIISNHWNGILIGYSNNNNISDNYIQNNTGGGVVFAFSCENNIVFNNTINENGVGVSLVSSNNNTISGNYLKSNIWHGIILGYFGYSSHRNEISGNTIELSGWTGIYHYKGYNTIISSNDVHSNGEYGIVLNSSNYVKVDYNRIMENVNGGIGVESSNNLDISFNNIGQNGNFGLNIIYDCNSNKIFCNNFLENKVNAYFRDSFTNEWNENYWDDWIGIKYQFLSWLPKIIFGSYRVIPWINVDRQPARKPYDIPELS